MLNPIFSIAHMRHMMPIFYDVGHKVRAPIAPGLPCVSLLTAARFCLPPDVRPSHLQLRAAVEERVRAAPAEIDMLNWMGRTALELIGQAGLGYSFDPLKEDLTPDVYADAIKAYVSVPSLLSALAVCSR